MKDKKKLGYFIFLLVATTVIVALGVNLGMKTSSYVDSKGKSSSSAKESKPLKIEEETKDFKIEYKEEAYALKNKKGDVVIENRRTLPIITSDKYQDQADLIQKYLIEVSDASWDMIKRSSDESAEDLEEQVGVDYVLSAIEQNDKYFTVVYDMSGNLDGVSWNDRSGYTFNTQTGELLSFEAIASNEEDLVNTIYDKLSSYINKQEYSSDLDENWNILLKDLIKKEGVWYLTKDGLSFAFPKYSLGPGYVGVISNTLTYDELGDLILGEYK